MAHGLWMVGALCTEPLSNHSPIGGYPWLSIMHKGLLLGGMIDVGVVGHGRPSANPGGGLFGQGFASWAGEIPPVGSSGYGSWVEALSVLPRLQHEHG
jgi:hypothetical protein